MGYYCINKTISSISSISRKIVVFFIKCSNKDFFMNNEWNILKYVRELITI